MSYPIYTGAGPIKNGNTEVEEFAEFIYQLHTRGLDDNFEAELVAFVNENGTQNLSMKQGRVLEEIVDNFSRECDLCEADIPLNEVLSNQKYCSYHSQNGDDWQ